MKNATAKKKEKSPVNSQFGQRARDAVFLFNITIAIYLMVSLVTYHSGDPGWSTTGIDKHVVNAGGRAGAWFADFTLYAFGYVTYLFPLILAYGAWFFRHPQEEVGRCKYLMWMKLSGFFLILFTGTALSSILFTHGHHLPYGAGGILGSVLSPMLEDNLNTAGAFLLLTPLLLIGVTFLLGVLWKDVFATCLAWILSFFKTLQDKSSNLISDWDEKRENAASRAQTREEPTIHGYDKDDPLMERKPTVSAKPREAAPPIVPQIITPKPAATASSKKPVANNGPVFKTDGKNRGLPPLTLLEEAVKNSKAQVSKEILNERCRQVKKHLADFGVDVDVVAVHPGPVITRYELDLAPGIKVSKITGLAKDLARSLSMVSVRVVEVIPGKSVIGLELPNEYRETVRLREILESEQYEKARSPLSMALGKDIAGHPVIVDLAKMPHLLVAGTTGAGKSVGLNAMLLSILYKASPKEVRMIMVDPKMLELSIYDGIPHLLTPVVTDMKDAANALRWCVAEMERRYALMASLGVRNLAGYNEKVQAAIDNGEPIVNKLKPEHPDGYQETLEVMPNILVLVDEFADLMMVVGKKVEQLIARIAQKARAAGIHLILATQRPSVDVITGLIKANIPTRISFQVSSRIDSRTVLDQQGAEQLLGHGDMLYLPPGSGVPVRVHGAFVADQEVHNVVQELKKYGGPNYLPDILTHGDEDEEGGSGNGMMDSDAEKDPLYDQVVAYVLEARQVSTSSLQRVFKLGFNRAARIVDSMEAAGIIGPKDGSSPRQVLAPPLPKEY